MKRHLKFMALLLAAVTLSLGSLRTEAKAKKPKHTPEHTTALKKCNDDYSTAAKEAAGKKGQEKTDAMAAAKKAKAECVAAAPQ